MPKNDQMRNGELIIPKLSLNDKMTMMPINPVSPTIAAAFPLGEPILATILAFFIFGESIGINIYIGGSITFLGLVNVIPKVLNKAIS